MNSISFPVFHLLEFFRLSFSNRKFQKSLFPLVFPIFEFFRLVFFKREISNSFSRSRLDLDPYKSGRDFKPLIFDRCNCLFCSCCRFKDADVINGLEVLAFNFVNLKQK